jgi:glutaredoxin 2
MAPMPLPQGPHARTDADGLLWVSEDRRAALLRAEKADAADDWTRADTAPPTAGSVVMARAALIHEAEMKAQAEARDAWVERQKAAEAEGRKRGVERMRRGINSWRDSIERKGDQ